MSLVDLVMPKMGESIMEATILKWLKQPGDNVRQDETVLEIATDKVDSEVPSITEGTLEEILYQVNDVVPIGSVIARIRTMTASATPTDAGNNTSARPAAEAGGAGKSSARPDALASVQNSHLPTVNQSPNYNPQPTNGARFYSPLVLNIAASEGVPLNELESIPGTGNEGRVTKKDILQYISDKRSGHLTGAQNTAQNLTQNAGGAAAAQTAAQTAPVTATAATTQPANTTSAATAIVRNEPPQTMTVHSGNVEIIEMDRMRRLIADHMVRSVHTSPHVTSMSEADVTHLVHWRDKVKKEFEKRENTKLTFTPLFIEALVRCIKKYPLINSSLDGDKIIIKRDINIGMATALPSGNLIVPVIRNADQLNLVGLARQVNTMADNARQGKLRPDDTQGGTFTLTNVGTFGSLMGTPIINQPQVAILAVGAIKKRPVVLETSEGDAIVIRHMMYLSLSYDHRIIDGSLGATFCTAVARELENFSPERQL
jgi:2-oxoglutarate dehydrogenase E2 component (dihydrolipoamide succinyltransferase)